MEYDERRYLYVCEGITDEDKLKKLGCLFVIVTGGKYIRSEIIAFLKEVHSYRQIVLVLDPDGPGNQIEKRLTEELGNCLSVKAKKKDAIKHGKVGIAEMEMTDLKGLMRPYILHDITSDEMLSFDEYLFYDLKLVGKGSKERRDKLVRKYHIPFTSKKNVEDCLLMLGITENEIKECIDE